MAKIRGLEAKLNRLRALRHDPTSSDLIAEVGTALEDASALVVALAAEIAGERALADLVPELAMAFDRFMNEPELDKAPRAKILIVEALNKLDCATEEVFLRGLYHVEASLDGQDSAAPLRGNCALYVEPCPKFEVESGLLANRASLRCAFPEPGQYTIQCGFFKMPAVTY